MTFGTVYTLGYSSPNATQRLQDLMSDPATLLIDVRKTAWSKIPEWRDEPLKALYGKRYRWAGKYLGNINYNNNKPIELADPDTGISGLKMYLDEGYNVILLCGCKDYNQCHRKTIVDLLREQMPRLTIEAEPEQEETIKCLSVQQPWAYFLANGLKDIENRDWYTSHRGPVLIHAGKKIDPEWFDQCQLRIDLAARYGLQDVPLEASGYATGAIVGIAELADVVTHSESKWFCGRLGFVLEYARPFVQPIPYRGQLMLFDIPLSVVQAELTHRVQL